MDNIVDFLSAAKENFIAAIAATLEAKKAANGENTPAYKAALENFKQAHEQLMVACDKAEEFVESAKQRIISQCLEDEATGSVVGEPGQPGLPPVSAVRLEEVSKDVRSLIMALQAGSSGGGAGPSSGGGAGSSSGGGAGSSSGGGSRFDARFNEDGGQQVRNSSLQISYSAD